MKKKNKLMFFSDTKKIIRLKLFFLILLSSNNIFSQCFWSENFSSYAHGTTSGSDNNAPVGADWISGNCPSCVPPAGDWWQIENGLMEARDVNNDVVFLETEVINISAYSNVSFSVDVSESGDHEGPYLNADNCTDQSNEDFANVWYSINGGAYTLVPNWMGWCGLYASCATHTFYGSDGAGGDCLGFDTDWVSSTVTIGGINANTLQIKVEARNSSASEYIRFDNICVEEIAVLPVELTSFNALYHPENNYVDLNWITETEINNDFFTLERSIDGINFEIITTAPGAGNSNTTLHYDYIDLLLNQTGNVYYRLKQTDFDGKFEYSKIVVVTIENLSQINIYPNPFKNNFTIQLSLESSYPMNIEIIDYLGRIVYKSVVNNVTENIEVSLEEQKLSSGTYFIKIFNETEYNIKKIKKK